MMKVRLLNLWQRVHESLWFVPALMCLAGVVLALAMARLDGVLATSRHGFVLLYGGSGEGARTLLATLAGSMITVAGVTFSITVVALSLASSQFGPRLLTNFMRDRYNQLVLGTFVATFLYCLVALSATDAGAVSSASATVGLVLAVASIGVLVYFIHHVSSSMRAEKVVDAVAQDLERAIERLFPEPTEQDDVPPTGAPSTNAPAPGPEASSFVTAPVTGYLQALDEDGLLSLAVERDLVLRAMVRPGHFVVAGDALLAVLGPVERSDMSDISDELEEAVRDCFVLGRRRTGEQDPEYGIHQLVEVAVRALSPGINDPYTAISCVDWLGGVLARIGRRPLRPPRRCGPDGKLRLLVDPITFAGLLGAAFDQIRQCAQRTPAVSLRLLEVLASIARRVHDPERRAAIRVQAQMVFDGAAASGLQEGDQKDLEERYGTVLESLHGPGFRSEA